MVLLKCFPLCNLYIYFHKFFACFREMLFLLIFLGPKCSSFSIQGETRNPGYLQGRKFYFRLDKRASIGPRTFILSRMPCVSSLIRKDASLQQPQGFVSSLSFPPQKLRKLSQDVSGRENKRHGQLVTLQEDNALSLPCGTQTGSRTLALYIHNIKHSGIVIISLCCFTSRFHFYSLYEIRYSLNLPVTVRLGAEVIKTAYLHLIKSICSHFKSILAIQVLSSEYIVGMEQTAMNFPLKFH